MNTRFYYTYDGTEVVPTTRKEILRWVQRIRQDLRDFEQAMLDKDLDALQDWANDAAGAAAQLQDIAYATQERQQS